MIKDIIWNTLVTQQWFRERVGGVWEYWYVGDGPGLHSEWFYRGCVSNKERPHYACKGTPVREVYND